MSKTSVTPAWHLRQIKQHKAAATKLVLKEIERKARAILRKHPELTEFIMRYGCVFFTEKTDTRCRYVMLNEHDYLESLRKYVDKWNSHFTVRSCPMRFTADGRVITNW